MRIAFVWQGIGGTYGQWGDGLYAAMKVIEKDHSVLYLDTNELDRLTEFNPDAVLYWEAPVTFAGKDRMNYWNVQALPYKKYLLFAGGEIKKEWVEGFELLFVESKINEQECDALGIPWKRAFGVNTDVFRPEKQPKIFDGVFQATCASWKRHWLAAEALKEKYAVMGRFQESDPNGFLRVREHGSLVLPELRNDAVAAMINASHTVINTSSYWGGGQRCTLEAMACGVTVIVMNDSPKNIEFVEEAESGVICSPTAEDIRFAVEKAKTDQWSAQKGHAYVQSKWTHHHYARAILEGIS